MTLMITEKCYIERNDVLTRQNLSNDANVRQLRDSAEAALLMGAARHLLTPAEALWYPFVQKLAGQLTERADVCVLTPV